jgi:hypothetical protein
MSHRAVKMAKGIGEERGEEPASSSAHGGMGAAEQVDVLLLLRPREFAVEEPWLDGTGRLQGIGLLVSWEMNSMRCLFGFSKKKQEGKWKLSLPLWDLASFEARASSSICFNSLRGHTCLCMTILVLILKFVT